jgi:cholesterol oxidase
MDRRRFLGLTTFATASVMGAGTFSLNSCKKDELNTSNKKSFKAIVIGSGFGGSISSLRLTEQGVDTLLLEMGKFYDVTLSDNTFSSNIPPDKRSTWLKTKSELPFGVNLSWPQKYVGVLDRVEYPNLNVYRNVCLGGGSISNGGVLLEPEEANYNRYLFPEIPFQELKNIYFPRVREKLGASKMPDDLFNSKHYLFAQACKQHAINAGFTFTHADSFYNFDIWRQETENLVPQSALKGELLYGNNNGIKNTLDRNYLSDALGTGKLTIQTLSRVTEIAFNEDKNLYTVKVERINESGIVQESMEFECTYLFVCAGSVGTSEILVKAREKGTLPNLNDEVGKYFGGNGNAFAIRKNINLPTGAMHSSPPTLSVLDYNNPISPLAAMQDIFPLGLDLNMLLMVGQAFNEYTGEYKYQSTTDTVQAAWAANGLQQSKEAMLNFITKMNTANGSELDTTFIKEGVSSQFTYHPLGGAVLNKSSDSFGRLKGYKNLYAIDGSMLPGTCAMVNPTLTISALAERNIEHIIKNDF